MIKITITKGNYIPGIPKHQFKLRAQYQVTPEWSIGTNIVAFSDRFLHGNENNKHQENSAGCSTDDEIACAKGKTAGFTVVNLDSQYNLGQGWQLWAKAINVFDQDYYSTGRLAGNAFTATGNTFEAETNEWRGAAFLSPGAPRAGWIGVRYEFK